MEGLGANFFGTYAALKFTGNQRRPTILGQLFKAAALITWMMVLFPIALIQLLLSIRVTPAKPPRQTTHGGYPRKFSDHVDDLQEKMK
jgi:hypothetical protein